MVRGIDHIELIVRDFNEYVEFMKTLGFEELTRTSHHGESVELKIRGENQSIFEVHQATGEEVIGVNHIAFRVDNARAAHGTLKTTNISCNEPNFVESTGRTTVNLRDPDGWRMQLVDEKREFPDRCRLGRMTHVAPSSASPRRRNSRCVSTSCRLRCVTMPLNECLRITLISGFAGRISSSRILAMC